MTRCLPSHVVSFKRGNAQTAYSSFVCGSITAATAPASVAAQFNGTDPAGGADAPSLARGGIHLDPRPVIRLFEAPN